MRTLGALFGLSIAAVACLSDPEPPSLQDRQRDACVIGGCSEELCADVPMFSPCIYRARFDCYRRAICERGADHVCGWTATPELDACLAAHPDKP
jgi:hypothetical protein